MSTEMQLCEIESNASKRRSGKSSATVCTLVDDPSRFRIASHISISAFTAPAHLPGFRADYSEEGLGRAMGMFQRAIEVDPSFARAYGALAIASMRHVFAGYTTAPAEGKDRALELALEAERLNPDSPQVLWALAYVYMYRSQFNEAITALQRAINLSPSYADAYALLALLRNNQGRGEEAIRLLEKGITLNPHYSWDYLYNLGRAHYALGQYKQAEELLRQALERNRKPSLEDYCFFKFFRTDGPISLSGNIISRGPPLMCVTGFSHPFFVFLSIICSKTSILDRLKPTQFITKLPTRRING